MNNILVYGPPKCGKTTFIVNEFCSHINKSPLILVPARENVRYIKKAIFSNKSISGYTNQRILTFEHLINPIVPKKAISPITKHCLLREITTELDLKHFSSAINYRGFYELLSDFIGELKMGLIMPDNFNKAINKKTATVKDKDIYKIYKSYQEKMNTLNLVDQEDKFLQALDRLQTKNTALSADYQFIYVDGFMNFSPIQLEIIKALNQLADQITITLTLDKAKSPDQEAIYAPTANTYRKLKKNFNFTKELAMPAVQHNIQTAITTCPGPTREIEEIAKTIKRLIVVDKIPPDNITVLFRNLTSYKYLIQEHFDNYGIPYSISDKQELIHSPTIRTILSLFEPVLDNWSRETIFKFLKSGNLNPEHFGDNIDIDNLETTCLQSGVISGKGNWNVKLKDLENRNFFLALIKDLDVFPQQASLKDYISILYKLIDKLTLISATDPAFKKLKDILDEMVSINSKTSLSIFYQYLEMTANSATVPFPPRNGRCVQILDVHRSRGLSFPVVFLGGLNEGLFPRQIHENPVYNDKERSQLRNAGIELEEAKQMQEQELFLFHLATSAGINSLYLSYNDINDEGKEILPSNYLDTYLNNSQLRKVHISDIVPETDFLGTNNYLNNIITYSLWHEKQDHAISLYNNQIGLHDQLLRQTINNIFAFENTSPGQLDDKRTQEQLAELFNRNYRFSISQFNEYGTCPFSYFCNRLLNLNPTEEPEEELAPRDEGTLYHDILWDFYTKLKKDLVLPFNKDTNIAPLTNIAANIAKEHFQQREEQGLINNHALWELKKHEILSVLHNIISYDMNNLNSIPSYFEVGFGLKKDLEMDESSTTTPLIINNDIKIAGKIDRIDINQNNMFVIIDYKSGNKEIKLSEILDGTNLQLPIYVLAVQDIILKNQEPYEAYFCHLKLSDKFHANAIKRFSVTSKGFKPNPKWDNYLNAAVSFVKEYANNIRTGKFPLRADKNCPAFCDYKNICRKK